MFKKNFLKKTTLFTIFGILALCLIPTVMAGPPGHFRDRPGDNNLLLAWWFGDPYYEFSASEDLYFRIGWGAWYEEIENDWAPKWPYKYKLFINDEEITLQRYDVPVPKENKEIVAKVSMWYHVFGPGYFTAGEEYTFRFEFWVRRPYQGDGLNYWRIYVDYWGIFSPPGTVHSFEFEVLNIVP
jgi:hypothetical protein